MATRYHFPTLSMALAMAMTRCFAWHFVETGEAFSALQMIDFAQKLDASRQPDGHSFFMVSTEGAIGVSPGQEYLTRWLFTPVPAGEERDAVLRQIEAGLAAAKADTPKEPGV